MSRGGNYDCYIPMLQMRKMEFLGAEVSGHTDGESGPQALRREALAKGPRLGQEHGRPVPPCASAREGQLWQRQVSLAYTRFFLDMQLAYVSQPPLQGKQGLFGRLLMKVDLVLHSYYSHAPLQCNFDLAPLFPLFLQIWVGLGSLFGQQNVTETTLC